MTRLFAPLLIAFTLTAYCFGAPPPKGLLTARLVAIDDIRADDVTLETAEDGTQYIAMRLHSPGATAVRVHISDMQLSAGQTLTLSNGSGTEVHGPFQTSGPTQSGEFWSDVIVGCDVILELETGPAGASDLPFKVDAIEAAEPSEILPPASRAASSEMRESWYRGVRLKHSVIDGIAVFQGDILLGPADELAPVDEVPRAQGKDQARSSLGVTAMNSRWPNAILPYVIAANLPSQARVTDAIAHWNSVMAGTVQLVPRTTEPTYISFNRAASGSTCSSYIGKVFSFAQPVDIGDYCSKGNVIHEIGHAWGLWHEHTREDRGSFVAVNLANVQQGMSSNFYQNISASDDIGPYDYNSIMHYNALAFSANGLPTIVTIPAGILIGQRGALSTGDIQGIKTLYPSIGVPPGGPVTTTVTANPLGSSVSVDGVISATPVTFTWTPGSIHTIAAVDTWTGANRSVFARWSDNGTQSHTVTASATQSNFKVDYAISYSVTATATLPGTAQVTPAAWHSMYPAQSSVFITAIAPAGYCFVSWTNLIAGTPSATMVVATRTYFPNANFQPGGISLSTSAVSAPVAGGIFTLIVTANSGCRWNPLSNSTWLKVTSVTSGTGSGTVAYTLAPNTTGATRVGTLKLEGQVVTVTQAGL